MAELRFLSVTHFPGPKIIEVSGLHTVLSGKECVAITKGARMAPDLLADKSLLQAIDEAGLTGLVAKELGQPLIDL